MNDCGIAKSHAFSLIGAFTMTDASGIVHRMLLMRNPWAANFYSDKWGPEDTKWTDALVAQIPYSFDPRTDKSGLFVAPITALELGKCFDSVAIAHARDDEGYSEVWYD